MLCAEHELVRRKSLRFFLDSCTLQTYNEPVFSNLHPGPYYCHTVCENENCEVRDRGQWDCAKAVIYIKNCVLKNKSVKYEKNITNSGSMQI